MWQSQMTEQNPQIENGAGDVNDVMPRSDGLGFFVILNKSSELRFGLGRSDLIFGPGWGWSIYELRDARARWLSKWVESWRWTNSQHRKIVSLSPCVENLNLKKVITVSYLNQKRVVSVSCFSDSYAYHEHYERFYLYAYFTYSYLGPILNILLSLQLKKLNKNNMSDRLNNPY